MKSFVVFLSLLVFISFLTFFWLLSKFKYWKRRGLISPPFSFLWGHMKENVDGKKSFGDLMWDSYNYIKSRNFHHGGAYIFWCPVYIPTDIQIVKKILLTDFSSFVDRGMYVNEDNDPISGHLFNLQGKRWRILRKKLTPTFTSGKMKMMHETLLLCTHGLHKVMDSILDEPVDVKDILGRFTTDVIGSCAFGLDCNSLENPESEFRLKGQKLFHRDFGETVKQFLLFIMPEVMRFFNMKSLPDDVGNFFMDIVEKSVKYRQQNGVFRKDFLHLLIQLMNSERVIGGGNDSIKNNIDDEERITLKELAAQVFIFFEAGFETSSSTMAFCLYELAHNRDIQEKVRNEIVKTLQNYEGKLTYEAAMDMYYLTKTIKETLRKYPSLPALMRICTQDYHVPDKDLVIEKNTKVVISVLGIQRDPEFYPDPDKFDPERFNEENEKTRPPFTFLSFGEGPRNCIGSRFGMMQTKVGLIALLINYDFTVNPKTQRPLKFDPKSVSLSAEGGIWLNARKISNETIQIY